MSTTPLAGLTLMPSGIYRNEEVYNLNVIKLEALAYGGAISRSVLDPGVGSPSPANGDVYIVPTGSPSPSGDFSGQADNIAVYYDGWKFIPAQDGATIWVQDESSLVQYRTSEGGWVNILNTTPYDVPVVFGGTPTSAQTIARFVIPRIVDFADDFAGSYGYVATNPGAQFDIDVQVQGSSVGTVSISTGGVFTFTTTAGALRVTAGERMEFVVPGGSPSEDTIAGISFTLLGTVPV